MFHNFSYFLDFTQFFSALFAKLIFSCFLLFSTFFTPQSASFCAHSRSSRCDDTFETIIFTIDSSSVNHDDDDGFILKENIDKKKEF